MQPKPTLQLNHLDLNLLIALDALLSEQNITAAGRRVHLTQSAMSGALGRLRDFFGDELLTPVGRKMIRTAMGDSLSAPVRIVLLKIKETISIIPGFDPATSRRKFSLMMSDYVSTVLLPTVFSSVETSAPHVGFEILSNNFSHPLEVLERADVDFIVMPPTFLLKEHPSQQLFEDSYSCVVWSGNARVGDSLSLDQYQEMGHVSLQFGRLISPLVDDFVNQRLGDARRIEVIAMNFNSVVQYIVGTHRVALIQTRLAKFYAQHHPIRLIPPPFDIPPMVETLQWHACFDKDPGSMWLRKVLMEAANRVSGH